MVEQVAEEGKAPLVMGGDHSIAIGTVAGMARHFRKKKKRMGLLWIDAHADMNTPQTSPSGNVHGMPLACCIGLGPEELTKLFGFAPKVHPRNVALVGLRDVDILERPHVRESGVRAFTMRDIDERGLAGRHGRSDRIADERDRRLSLVARHGLRGSASTRRAWERRSAAAPLTAKRIWPWK